MLVGASAAREDLYYAPTPGGPPWVGGAGRVPASVVLCDEGDTGGARPKGHRELRAGGGLHAVSPLAPCGRVPRPGPVRRSGSTLRDRVGQVNA